MRLNAHTYNAERGHQHAQTVTTCGPAHTLKPWSFMLRMKFWPYNHHQSASVSRHRQKRMPSTTDHDGQANQGNVAAAPRGKGPGGEGKVSDGGKLPTHRSLAAIFVVWSVELVVSSTY